MAIHEVSLIIDDVLDASACKLVQNQPALSTLTNILAE